MERSDGGILDIPQPAHGIFDDLRSFFGIDPFGFRLNIELAG